SGGGGRGGRAREPARGTRGPGGGRRRRSAGARSAGRPAGGSPTWRRTRRARAPACGRDRNSGLSQAQTGRRGRMTAGREALLVATACALVYLSAIGDRVPFFTRGEPREGLVAREILRRDEWLAPARAPGRPSR